MVTYRYLQQVCEILNGDRSTNYPNGNQLRKQGIPFINAGHLKNGGIDFSHMDYISSEKYDGLSGAKIKLNDILFCLRGSLGKYAIANIDAGAPASSLAVLRVINEQIDYRYLFQILGSTIIKKQIEVTNNGSSQPNLSAENVKRFIIPVPSIFEQKAIAAVLSDVDELIDSLEKLIEKKKAIKQGAMQELLTGRKRLPGFQGEWAEQVCYKMGDFFKGHGVSMKDVKPYGYPCIMYGDIYVKFNTYFKNADFKINLNTALRSVRAVKNDVFFTASGENAKEIGKCVSYQGEEDIYIGGDIIALRPNPDICSLFLAYAQNSEYVLHQKASLAQGHTVVHINLSNIMQLKILVPPTLKEQEAIADVLLSMDSEIEALTQKLEKIRQIKQGMMQELLTGRIRLLETGTQNQKKAKAKEAPKVEVEQQGHNEHFHEAVILSTVVSLFAGEQFPLGRFRRQKLAYLLHRHAQESTQGFLKKAAGPYNPTIRYKDESIALKASYVAERGKGKFVKGEKNSEAVDYFLQWYGTEAVEWLGQFQYRKNDDLEVLTTVAEAIVDLKRNNLAITVEAVKQVIRENPEWRPKLDKDCFNDFKIQSAIKESQKLFG